MNHVDHLVSILAEESVEVAHRCTKALRFGLDEIQPGHGLNNAERIYEELNDLIGVWKMLAKKGVIPADPDPAAVEKKMAKIEHFLRYSAEIGRLRE